VDEPLTGIPGWGDSTDGIAIEYIALLDLAKGPYTLGVNSDDGFAATISPDFRDKMPQLIGVYPGNRGAASSEFNIYVQEPGLYPFRVLWWEGDSEASVEIYSLVNGEKVLINDPDVDGSIKAYTVKGAVVGESTTELAETGRAKITSARPSPGGNITDTGSYTFVIEGSVNADSVALSIDGAAVNADVSKSGSKITVSYTPAEAAERGSAHTASLTYDEGGVVRAASIDYSISLIPGGTIFIETEDFNYEGGAWKTFEETKLGGSYAGLGAEEGIDFHNFGNASPLYRVIDGNHPGMTANVDNDRGDFSVEAGWKVGWNNSGDWYNYTRDFPEDAMYYDVWGRFASGGSPVDNSLSIVSGDTLSEDQTATMVGVFQGPATGGWDTMKFFPMTDTAGNPTAVKIGGETTVRLTMVGGNMDSNYLMFTPSAVQFYPPLLASYGPSGEVDTSYDISAVFTNRDGSIESVVLKLNGKAVDAKVSTADGQTTVSYSVTDLGAGAFSDITLSWIANEGTTGSQSWSNMTSPHSDDSLYIEAEDFNYDGGEWMTFEETRTGGAYDGLEMVSGIDYNNTGHYSPNYRVNADNHPGFDDALGFDGNRGDWDMDVDFRMGWNKAGDWFNYTRDFPAEETSYNVFGRFSSGGAPPNNKLSIVTSDSTEPDQTTEDVGVFQGPATGCWTCFEFFPMTDAAGNRTAVKIGGETTVRLTMMGGNMDYNYLMFVPVKGVGGEAPTISVVNNGDGTITVTFEGTLQAAPTVNGPWQDVDAESPLTLPADQAQQFGRAKN
jgi:hypothetical protein